MLSNFSTNFDKITNLVALRKKGCVSKAFREENGFLGELVDLMIAEKPEDRLSAEEIKGC